MSIDSASLAAGALAQRNAAFSQQVATLAMGRQIDAERSVAGLVAETASVSATSAPAMSAPAMSAPATSAPAMSAPAMSAPVPRGQGQVLDVTV